MKAIIIMAVLAYSKALYPPPNYNSIVKPSSTYFVSASTQHVQPHFEQHGKLAYLTFTEEQSSHPQFASTTVVSIPKTTDIPNHSSSASTFVPNKFSASTEKVYASPTTSTSAAIVPSSQPALSTSYEYTIPKATAAPSTSQVYPIPGPTAIAPQQEIQFQVQQPINRPVATNYEYIILNPTNSPATSVSEYGTPLVLAPIPQYSVPNVEQQNIIPHVPVVQVIRPSEHVNPNVPVTVLNCESIQTSKTTNSEYAVQHVEKSKPVSSPIKINFEYSITSPSSTTTFFTKTPSPDYGIPHLHSQNINVIPSSVPAIKISATPSPTSNYVVQHITKAPISEQGTLLQSISTPIKTEYEYSISQPTLPPVASVPVAKQDISSVPTSTTEYFVPQSHSINLIPQLNLTETTNLPTALSSEDKTPTKPVIIPTSEYGVPSKPIETKAPIIKTSYEYDIPSQAVFASPSSEHGTPVAIPQSIPVLHAEYGVPQ